MQLPLLVFANLLDDNVSLIPPLPSPHEGKDGRLIIYNIYLSEHYLLLPADKTFLTCAGVWSYLAFSCCCR